MGVQDSAWGSASRTPGAQASLGYLTLLSVRVLPGHMSGTACGFRKVTRISEHRGTYYLVVPVIILNKTGWIELIHSSNAPRPVHG
jgi:hypothetical protein